jgi:hypothetical protein
MVYWTHFRENAWEKRNDFKHLPSFLEGLKNPVDVDNKLVNGKQFGFDADKIDPEDKFKRIFGSNQDTDADKLFVNLHKQILYEQNRECTRALAHPCASGSTDCANKPCVLNDKYKPQDGEELHCDSGECTGEAYQGTWPWFRSYLDINNDALEEIIGTPDWKTFRDDTDSCTAYKN